MNLKLLFSTLLFSALSIFPANARTCPIGNPRSTAYMERENNRCEGVRDRNVSSSFDLVSFATTNLSDYPNTLTIRIPGTGNTTPNVRIQSFYRSYTLDQLDTDRSQSGHTFSLHTGRNSIVQRAGIPFSTLRATAYITENSNRIYLPVILGTPSESYEFILRNPNRITMPTLEIRRENCNGQQIYANPSSLNRSRHSLIWDYGSASSGTYALCAIDGSGQRRSFIFEHDRDWF